MTTLYFLLFTYRLLVGLRVPDKLVTCLKLFFILGFIMINFLVTDICGIIPSDYFKHIIQFENTLEADIYFTEHDINTEQLPFYEEQYEYSSVDENTAKSLLRFAKNNKIEKFTLIESDYYKALCFTEKERNKFVAQRIAGSSEEKLEITDVETAFVYGFVNN